MAKLNDDGSLDFSEDDWMAPGTPPKKTPTDPNVQAGYADPNSPEELAKQNALYGAGGTAMTKPSPDSTWDGAKWNTPAAPAPAAGGDADMRAQIAKWAAMPGADPSLAADPDYWVKAITAKGGLNAGNTQYWQDASVGPTAFFNNPNRESGSGPTAGGGSSGSGGSGSKLSDFLMQLLSKGGGNNTDPARSALMGRLNSLMDQYSQPVTADDPTIKASTDAYTGQVGRSVNRFKKTAAERAYAEGVPSGAFDSQIGNAEMSGGRAVGDMQTQLMRDEMLSRRTSLMNTLQSAGSLLSAQDQADIQNKIANMDAVLKSAGIDVSNRGLDIQSQLGNKGLDIQELLGKLTAGNQSKSIDNQNGQFYDKLGADEADTGSSLDSILSSLLLK